MHFPILGEAVGLPPLAGIAVPGNVEETLAINDTLDHFATIDAVAASLVKLHFFAG